jgi:hypothetical protein
MFMDRVSILDPDGNKIEAVKYQRPVNGGADASAGSRTTAQDIECGQLHAVSPTRSPGMPRRKTPFPQSSVQPVNASQRYH